MGGYKAMAISAEIGRTNMLFESAFFTTTVNGNKFNRRFQPEIDRQVGEERLLRSSVKFWTVFGFLFGVL